MQTFKLKWKEDWVGELTSSAILDVIENCDGHLSGTLRLTSWHSAHKVVAQVYFPHGEMPRVVAVYDRVGLR